MQNWSYFSLFLFPAAHLWIKGGNRPTHQNSIPPLELLRDPPPHPEKSPLSGSSPLADLCGQTPSSHQTSPTLNPSCHPLHPRLPPPPPPPTRTPSSKFLSGLWQTARRAGWHHGAQSEGDGGGCRPVCPQHNAQGIWHWGGGGGLSGQRVYTPLYGILNIVCKCWLTHKHKGRKKAAEGGDGGSGGCECNDGGAEERDKSLQGALLVIWDSMTRLLT